MSERYIAAPSPAPFRSPVALFPLNTEFSIVMLDEVWERPALVCAVQFSNSQPEIRVYVVLLSRLNDIAPT